MRAVDDGGTADGGVDTSAPQTFAITLVNQAPVAVVDAPGVLENSARRRHVRRAGERHRSRDRRALDRLLRRLGARQRRLTDNGGGSFTYVPAPHFAGTDTFSYTASDGNGNTATAVVTITVTAVPDPPAAADDAYVTPQGVALVQAAPGVLANDGDSGGGTLVVDTTPVAGPSNGA